MDMFIGTAVSSPFSSAIFLSSSSITGLTVKQVSMCEVCENRSDAHRFLDIFCLANEIKQEHPNELSAHENLGQVQWNLPWLLNLLDSVTIRTPTVIKPVNRWMNVV